MPFLVLNTKNVLNPSRLPYCLIDDQIELWVEMGIEADLRVG